MLTAAASGEHDPVSVLPVHSGAVVAQLEARAAADRAQVQIVQPRDEHSSRLVAAAGDQVWGAGGTFAPNELRALVHAGDPVHLALDLTQAEHPVVGFAVGFLGWSPDLHVHSHQVGVLTAHRHRGVGYALKLAQRHTCLSHGITDMRWTFDPLIRRNTAFNLGALGARAASFHPNFYGAMSDDINGGDASDRLEAMWDLQKPLPPRTGAPPPGPRAPCDAGPAAIMILERNRWPHRSDVEPSPGALVAVPAEYEVMRRSNPSLGRAWRSAVRQALEAAYAAGLRVGRVTETGYQLVGNDED